MKILLTCLVFLFFSTLTFAQRIDLDDSFTEKLEAAGLEFLAPLDAGYKDIALWRNPYQSFDFAIRSRREKLEIRYLIEPWRAGDRSFLAPHVKATRLLLHLATNDQDMVMTGLDVEPAVLHEQFNADWGKVFFFQPKRGFSHAPNCKMLALFREGKGMAYVLFLFDEPGPELDFRFEALRFVEEDLR